MATLYLTEQGSMIRKTSGRLVVTRKREELAEIPCAKLETIFLYGAVQVTTQALAALLDHGIELAFFTLSGRLRGQLTPPKAKNVVLRMKQYELVSNQESCLALAKDLVAAKIGNSVAVLRRYRKNAPEAVSLESLRDLEGFLTRSGATRTLDELRGTEGAAAARYFTEMGRLVPPGFEFSGRNRRPPRDPVNALLSFGYVLVGNELQALLDGMGFDPYLGVYHQLSYGRPSLALDLLEELRAPLVDRFSLGLLRLGKLASPDFQSTPEKGVLLTREGLKTYFRAYEEELTRPLELAGEKLTFRQVFRRQAERFAACLVRGEAYRSFRWPL